MKNMQIIQILVLFNAFLALCCNSVNAMLQTHEVDEKEDIDGKVKADKSFVKGAIDQLCFHQSLFDLESPNFNPKLTSIRIPVYRSMTMNFPDGVKLQDINGDKHGDKPRNIINIGDGLQFKFGKKSIECSEAILEFPETKCEEFFTSRYLSTKLEIQQIIVSLVLCGKNETDKTENKKTAVFFFRTNPINKHVHVEYKYDADRDKYIMTAPKILLYISKQIAEKELPFTVYELRANIDLKLKNTNVKLRSEINTNVKLRSEIKSSG